MKSTQAPISASVHQAAAVTRTSPAARSCARFICPRVRVSLIDQERGSEPPGHSEAGPLTCQQPQPDQLHNHKHGLREAPVAAAAHRVPAGRARLRLLDRQCGVPPQCQSQAAQQQHPPGGDR